MSFAFGEGGNYPTDYRSGLFFADYSRDCIWRDAEWRRTGCRTSSKRRTFVAGASNPVDLQIGPGGDLFYADHLGGAIRRISYTAGQHVTDGSRLARTRRTARLRWRSASTGPASSDPDPGDTLSYAWDLDGDGQFDDSTAAEPTFTYNTSGTYNATLRVTDTTGAFATDAVTISAGNTAPTVSISSPTTALRWKVGDQISFSGSASDPQDGALPASALSWSLRMQHCPSTCHTHQLQDFPGVASGSFVGTGPRVPVAPRTGVDRPGLGRTDQLPDGAARPAHDDAGDAIRPVRAAVGRRWLHRHNPFARTVIVGSKSTITAPSPQTLGGVGQEFVSWSDGGAQSHERHRRYDAERRTPPPIARQRHRRR